MILLVSAVWASTATVPGTHANVTAACQDSSVDVIEVSTGATLGSGLCSVTRDLVVTSTSGARVPSMSVSSGAKLVLEGVEIQVSGTDPGVQVSEASVTLDDVHLFFASGTGDGIYGWDGTVIVRDSLLEGFFQSTPIRLFAFQAPLALEVIDSELSSNTYKGAYIAGTYDHAITVDWQGGEFTSNAADAYGPIELQGDVTMTIDGTLFDNNVGQTGGVLHVGDGGSLSVQDAVFVGNTAGSDGGAIYAYGSPVSVSGTWFEGNSSEGHGGAINVEYGATLTSFASVFIANAAKKGGAIKSEGDLSLDDGYFCQNTALTGVGAAVSMETATADLGYSVFQDHEDTALHGSSMEIIEVEHLSLIGNETGIDPGSGDLDLAHTLFWGNNTPLVNSATAVQYETNGFDTRPDHVPSSQGEYGDAGFVSAFTISWAAGECGELPYLRSDSPLIAQASDGLQIGALGPDEGGGDSGGDSGTGPDSSVPTDSEPGESGLEGDSGSIDSTPPEVTTPVSYLSGGCRGPASAFLLAGLLLVARTFRERAD
ncbi:MAG: hypothetical protein GY913_30125 [Proteobacteria bacterium]|nr:hypothetical protein [Pseudomonadota bacterium]MCP4921175.1 hypothetical protein [Pseudomonadota bacterium]